MPDKFIIDSSQAAYDWIFDRTGILKGQIAQALIITYLAVRLGLHPIGLAWLSLPLIIALFLASSWNSSQKKRKYVVINAQAVGASHSFSLLTLRMAIFFILMNFKEDYYWWSFSYGITLLLFTYLMCVKVRDREPPESSFFNFKPTGA